MLAVFDTRTKMIFNIKIRFNTIINKDLKSIKVYIGENI